MAISLDPNTLPELDILTLAQTGQLIRAERETPENGVPAFVSRSGWNELVQHYAQENETPTDTAQRVLIALERSVSLLMTEAAKAAQHHSEETPSLYTLTTDLFPSNAQTRLVFVRDISHPVACALIGTPHHLTEIITPPKSK